MNPIMPSLVGSVLTKGSQKHQESNNSIFTLGLIERWPGLRPDFFDRINFEFDLLSNLSVNS